MIDTPELDKIRKVSEASRNISEFLEWARYSGYHITKTQTVQEEREYVFKEGTYEVDVDVEVPVHPEKMLAEYFEIDLNKVEQERQALLKAQAAHNEQHADTYTVHPTPEES